MRVLCAAAAAAAAIVWISLVSSAESFYRHHKEDTCVPLPYCQPAVELLLSKPFDPFTTKLLKLSQCGTAGKYPKVRCEEIIVTCKTPDNKNGTCTPVKDCDSYITMLRTLDVSEQLTKKYLKEFQCGGTTEDDIQVCCPQNRTELTDKSLIPAPELEQCGLQANDNRIVGGTVADLDEFPWMALLQYKKGRKIEPACAGTLINNNYVLTAAHCADADFVRSAGYVSLENVVLGEYDTRTKVDCVDVDGFRQCAPPAKTYKILRAILHPRWREKHEDDIGLLRLDKRVQFNEYIKPICLPLDGINLKGSENFYVAGWGSTKQERKSPIKMKAMVPLAQRSQCLGSPNENQVCAGEVNGRDTCIGDSGGPLMLEHQVKSSYLIFVIGIVSYGPSICGSGPSVYTYVPNYIEWINEVMKIDGVFL